MKMSELSLDDIDAECHLDAAIVLGWSYQRPPAFSGGELHVESPEERERLMLLRSAKIRRSSHLINVMAVASQICVQEAVIGAVQRVWNRISPYQTPYEFNAMLSIPRFQKTLNDRLAELDLDMSHFQLILEMSKDCPFGTTTFYEYPENASLMARTVACLLSHYSYEQKNWFSTFDPPSTSLKTAQISLRMLTSSSAHQKTLTKLCCAAYLQ